MSVKYNKTTVDKFVVKGVLNEDGTAVAFETKDGETVVVNIMHYIEQFASQPIEMTIQTKYDEELYLPSEE